jgi:hypothetical protein
MVYAIFEKNNEGTEYFQNKEKKNLDSWKKIEDKRKNILKDFIKECKFKNKDIIQSVTDNKQHHIIENK